MEPPRKEAKDNPSASANLLSKIFFCWLNPLFRIGYKKKLEEDDMYKVLPEDASHRLGEELQWYWNHEVQRAAKEMRPPKLSKVLVRCYWKSYSLIGIFIFIEEVIKVIQPVLLGKLVEYFEINDPIDKAAVYEAYMCAAGISLSAMALAVLHHLYFYHVQRAGMKIRVAMCHMIYRKALHLNNKALAKTTTGQIVNLVSNDVNKFDEVTLYLHFLWIAPLQAATVVWLLMYTIGPSCLAGMAVFFFVMPVQTMFGRLFSRLRADTAMLTDERIRTMNEVITGIRVIKMYGWEKPFIALVDEIRRMEISKIMKSSYLRGLNMASFFVASKIIIFNTVCVYVLTGNTLSPSRVFMAVSLYGAVRLTITLFFPFAIEKVSETLISIRRIQNFLLLDEVAPQHLGLPGAEKDCVVKIQDIICYWDKMLETPTLQNVSFTVRPEQLLAVIGPVGAGKSSLLSAILGELSQESGVVKVKGSLTYTSQQPWILPGTIRSNILFGKELNPKKYDRVLRACALKRDMDLLPGGDLAMVGDRGANLSGGQKARVSLARAVYQDADIYLLDDPLSAVDAEVGRHLFEECICGLLRKKPRVLVTHQLQYLKAADHIVVLKEGQMVAQGTYSELQSFGLDFTSLLKEEEENQEEERQGTTPILGTVSRLSHTLSDNSMSSLSSSRYSLPEGGEPPSAVVRPTEEETRSEGNVGLRLYVQYFMAGANFLVLLVLLLLNALAHITFVLQDWWLACWASEQKHINVTEHLNGSFPLQLDLDLYLGVYAGLTASSVVFGFLRSLVFFNVLVRSSQTLHNSMFTAILRTPVQFFDINPIGRILNRFSKDIGYLDSLLPWTFVDFIQVFLQVIGVIVVAAVIIPWILIPIVPLLAVFLILRCYFLRTSRDIKRLESTTRSPVFSHLSSSLQGLSTIRAFKVQQSFQQMFDEYQDLHSEAWFLFLTTSRWLAVRLDGICSIFVTITAFGCIYLRDGLEPGAVGLALSYAVTLTGMFQWGVRQSAEIENMMTSVERVVEYAELESEAPWETDKQPPHDWPRRGSITFDRVAFSYSASEPLVLKNLTVVFTSREKVGIVGRTGAGKSSLISALFRLAEPEGRIRIDGVLTSTIGLHTLRQKMSIIPQDPVLFTGTMRKNLDPFRQHTDEDLWNALQEVQMKAVVEELPNKLETLLTESGSNFSVGQRQLVCLARAILRKNRILIIDEATANVDPRTDSLIQQTIRDKFQECTVLTIAHRLNTIIDCDRILVLDAGRIREYDEPYVLLQNQDGLFYQMVQQTGRAEAASLLHTAKQVYTNKKRLTDVCRAKDIGVIFETSL
nr:PREDICTED: multidrug resistance-associated protein 4 isoform X1 [Paralichthys olivaceus]XP_019945776.1 PREDICTED: multidrug resistance-associated protein 4 isoform X1 [Paralichthys olivaceus]XP_019945777.1 PREDICTED: multidrug resistance-associated protein 4 isoform X1 [Paralichthys olivaceus]XP_019945778.1 PREDICTED: multidrug resistance-associated protein 4 isoform X1 [Paralichthys olivaceus]XP_019945779.1 PREDICTED: multidrug resistance-associated protein 4 isoform X1 [Paralichthys olivac